MVDPWRHLNDWKKPSNKADSELEAFFQEAKTKTDFATAKRVILRGKTTEVIDQITDGELDFAYIDADHTLKGIAIDLIRVYPKVRNGGFLGGDDFTRSVWEHNTRFEPRLVFPFAGIFCGSRRRHHLRAAALAVLSPENEVLTIRFYRDITGHYDDVGLQTQFAPEKLLKLAAGERIPRLLRVARKIRGLLPG